MSLTNMRIPNTMVVGFQDRKDTYTGKLAYVTYLCPKGKLRKEVSWEGWRDKKIEAEYIKNVPTSGFVLNKKVGGGNSGWNPRNICVRIYDPRGFEFEISVANLLFILEECDAYKGKGLDGDFVYALDGAELVLLPVTSMEYKSSVKYTELQQKKVTKKDMVEGCWYKTKKQENMMYLGRHEFFSYEKNYYNTSNKDRITSKKMHVFFRGAFESMENGGYYIQSGFTNLGERTTEIVDPNFATQYDVFKCGIHCCDSFKITEIPFIPKWNNNNGYAFIRDSGVIYKVSLDFANQIRTQRMYRDKTYKIMKTHIIDYSESEYIHKTSMRNCKEELRGDILLRTFDDLNKMYFFNITIETKQGTHYTV